MFPFKYSNPRGNICNKHIYITSKSCEHHRVCHELWSPGLSRLFITLVTRNAGFVSLGETPVPRHVSFSLSVYSMVSHITIMVNLC